MSACPIFASARCTTLIEELEKIADIDDDLFEGDLITIEKCCKSISEFSRGLVSREGLEKLRERVTAMINAYQRFRLAFVAEKGEFLMEKNVYGDRLDEQTYLELFSSSLNTEYEREQILQYIRSHGPQIALRLAEATGMPVSKIRTHLISLKQLGQVNIGMGEREGYLLYDVPKVPQKEVLLIANFIENISKLNTDFNGCVDSLKDIRAENLSLLISSLDGMNVATKNLVEFASYDERLSETLRAFQNEVINRVNLITEIRGKIPKTKPKVSIEELMPVEVPEVDAKYADLIEFKPLVGFGAVDWDEKLCLGCKSCQEICPEAALELTSAWNISTLFKMKSEDLQNLPESRRMLYQTIKNLSKIQPTKPIQLPEEALGFGEVSYNPIKCIACKRCEERCPSEAVKVKEIWNFQEVIKLLTKVV